MWRTICAGLVIAGSLLVGCNKESEDIPATAPAQPVLPDAVAPHPTTEALLNGPWTPTSLQYDPFMLTLPQGWELKTLSEGANVVLEGPTPTDTVGIRLAVQYPLDAIREKRLEADATADAALRPDLVKGDVVRDIPGARVIEQLTVDLPVQVPTTQSISDTHAATRPAMETIQTLHWIFTVCVPADKGYIAYELRFMGLTLSEYKQDQDFLRRIMNSLAYVPHAAEATTTDKK
jgi:hypothetical protein